MNLDCLKNFKSIGSVLTVVGAVGGRPKNTRQPEGGQGAAGTQHLPLGTDKNFGSFETGP